MRAGTWATVIAILIIIAIGWWAIDWTGRDTSPVSTVTTEQAPTQAPPQAQAPTQAPPGQQQGQAPPARDGGDTVIGVTPENSPADAQQTVGEPQEPSPRPTD